MNVVEELESASTETLAAQPAEEPTPTVIGVRPEHVGDEVPALIEELSERIRRVDFVSAIRLVECLHSDKPRLGEAVRIRDDVLRLSQHVSLGFQGTALHGLQPARGKHAYRLHCNFTGLLGSNGPLPLHYTEYADQRARHHGDPTFREFIDLFNHRLLSLLYRATAHFDPVINLDRARGNAFDDFLGALGGHMLPGSRDRDGIVDGAKRFQVAWYGSKSKSPDGLLALIAHYFELPARVLEFQGDWLALPGDALIRLGRGKGRPSLGVSTYLGRRVWSTSHKFKLQLGPLSWSDYLSFRPGGKRARTLYDLIRNYLGDEWDWDFELIVREGDVGEWRLDRGRSLGFDSWLTGSRSRKLSEQSVVMNWRTIRYERETSSRDNFPTRGEPGSHSDRRAAQ